MLLAERLSPLELPVKNITPYPFLTNTAYDASRLFVELTESGTTPVIPSTDQQETDFALYKKHNLIKRFVDKSKQFRYHRTQLRQTEIYLLLSHSVRINHPPP